MRKLTPYILLLPFLSLFFTFFVAPFLFSIYVALFKGRGRTLFFKFVGLANFIKGVNDPKLWEAIINMWIFTLIWIPILLVSATTMAIYFNRRRKIWSSTLRVVAFLPYAIPSVVGSIMWSFMYNPRSGGLTYLLSLFNLKVNLLDPSNLMYALVNIIAWEYLGFNVMILLAGLRSIPDYIYEAATIDGADTLRQLWYIQLPLIKRYILFISATTIVGAQLLFNEPYILSRIAPLKPNFTPNTYIYNIVSTTGNINYAAALGMIVAAISFALTFVLFRYIMR